MTNLRKSFAFLAAAALLALAVRTVLFSQADAPDIGSRMELFVDSAMIAARNGVELRLHPPRPAEVAIRFDQPWEGESSAYVTVLRDGDLYRMYYRCSGLNTEGERTCYAESTDGAAWTKPPLGLYAWEGSKENNIVWEGIGTHDFTPFVDTRPDVAAGERYKAVGRGLGEQRKTLYAFSSPDGLHWKLMSENPVITDGAFDSQNLAFWDATYQKYVCYYRIFQNGYRGIARAESDDFLTWTPGQAIITGEGPPEDFYTNATVAYFREPRYYFAFPKRFARDRKRLPEHTEMGISEGVFMSSRDGSHFDRTFREALIRPGRDRRNWGDRGSMTAWGLLQTAPDEMSIYYSQHYRYDTHHLRRGVFRIDGIASAHAGAEAGKLTTKPFRFSGSKLVLNYATSATGSVRVEILGEDGKPAAGHTMSDAVELYGDEIMEAYSWKGGGDVSALAGQPVRLRVELRDADLYSWRFE